MFEVIKNLLLQQKNSLGCLLHIGAGSCSELDDYVESGFSKIRLYEADANQYSQLQEKILSFSQVQAYQKAIAAQQGMVNFRRMNNPYFNGMFGSDALKPYFPNLELVDEQQVEALPLIEVIKDAKLDQEKVNVLVLEALEAATFLQKMDEQTLQMFSWVIVKLGDASIADFTELNEALNAKMKTAAFPLVQIVQSFPFSVKVYKRNDEAIALKQELEQATSHLADKERAFDNLEKEREELIYRQTKLDEEVVKAEAQLELIKDVVLREKAF